MTPVLFEFLAPDGSPIVDTPFDILLERSDQEEEATGVILPRQITARTDMDGRAIVSLVPTVARYHVTMMDKDGGAALHHDFYVPVLNSPDTVVSLADLIVARDVKLSITAYDEVALLRILNAKAQAMASADEARAAADSAQLSADFADDAIQLTVDARNAAQTSALQAAVDRAAIETNIQSVHDNALLAEDRAAAALAYKNDAAGSATTAGNLLASTTTQAGLASQSAVDAQGSEDAANTARDEALDSAAQALASKTASETARDLTTAARDVTFAARDVANAARDTAVSKAAQLASQLAAFNEIYIGKFAVAPALDGNGNALKVGAIYENTVEGKIYQWEADLAWHAYDEESQLQLNNAILSANNAAASAASALGSMNAASQSATDSATSAAAAEANRQAAVTLAAEALASRNAAATSEGNASNSAGNAANSAATSSTKAGEAAQSAADAAVSAALATSGQVQADWTQTDTVNKGFIKNKPLLAAVATSGNKADVGLGNVNNTSDAAKPVSTAQQTALDLKQSVSGKDASDGYVGLSGFKVALKNAAGTVVSYLTSVASIARNWTLPDKDGVIALVSDITGTNSGVNTGDETGASIRTKVGATALTGSNTGDETNSTLLTKLGIASISGTNTGDETQASIKAKLGATVVTGSNTGDETQASILTKLGATAVTGSNTGDQTLTSLGIPNVNNTSDANKPISTATQAALDTKAAITYVDAKVAALVAASPAALDTLAELATALGNDGNFATTMTNSLAGKAPLTGAGTSGTWGINITGAAPWGNVTGKPTTLVGYGITDALSLNGGAMTGGLTTRIPVPVAAVISLNGSNAPLYVSQATVPSNGTVSFTPFLHNTTVLNGAGYVQHVSIGAYRPGTIGWGGAVYMAIGGSDNNATESFLFSYGGSISHSNGSNFLHSQNFNSYAPTLTGGGASGTWSINVTGGSNLVNVITDENFTGNSYLTLNRGSGPAYAQQYNSGKLYFVPSTGALVSTGTVAASGAGGFLSSTYAVNQRNPIWRFGNADAYGISYFQGTTGWGGGASDDTIGFHFGTASSVNSAFQFHTTGKAWFAGSLTLGNSSGPGDLNFKPNAAGDTGDIVWYNTDGSERHRFWDNGGNTLSYRFNMGAAYTMWHSGNLTRMTQLTNDLSYMPGEYISGGNQLPNYFGSNKLKLQMISGPGGGSGMPAPAAAWNDVLWMSSYGGGDVKGSNALIMGKTGTFIGFARQDYDSGAWGTINTIWHSGNMNPPAVSAVANSTVQRDPSGYLFGTYINLTDEGVNGYAGAVSSIICKRGDNYYRSTSAQSVKNYLGIVAADINAPISTSSPAITDLVMAKHLRWQNYGNGHVIFDASSSLSPAGSSVNNTNPTNPWSATYPTLMGWNGADTYGVRVDRARVAESISNSQLWNVRLDTPNRGSYGSISIAGTTNGWCGIDFTPMNITFMTNGGTHGYYINNNAWIINWDNSGNFNAYGNVTAYSDERLKENWRDVPADFIEQWAKVKSGTYDRIDSKETQVGVSAQSVQAILPNAVSVPDAETGMLSLNYGGVAAVATVELAKKVLEQDQQIKDLTNLVQSLINHVKELSAK